MSRRVSISFVRGGSWRYPRPDQERAHRKAARLVAKIKEAGMEVDDGAAVRLDRAEVQTTSLGSN